MLQGLAKSICVSAKKGSAADVTPNAVNWATLSFDSDSLLYGYSEKQITGINQTITLQVQLNNTQGFTLYYLVSTSAGDIVSGDASSLTHPGNFGMNSIANNGTFTVTNNQYVTFGATISCFIASPVVTVKNQSNSDATLDTFALSFSGEC